MDAIAAWTNSVNGGTIARSSDKSVARIVDSTMTTTEIVAVDIGDGDGIMTRLEAFLLIVIAIWLLAIALTLIHSPPCC